MKVEAKRSGNSYPNRNDLSIVTAEDQKSLRAQKLFEAGDAYKLSVRFCP